MASTEYLALFAMYVFASYAVARRFVSPEAAFTLGLLCAVNAYMHFMSDQAAADLPFAVTTVAFLFFATARPGRTQEIIATAFCVAAYLFRTAGLALILAWICDALLKRRFRAAFIRLAVNFLPVAAWNRYIARVERSPEYARTAYSYQRADFLFYNVSYRINAMLKDTYRPEAGKISVHDLLTQRLLQNAVAFPAATGEAVTSQRPFWELNEIAATRHTGIHIRLPNAIFEAILVLIRPLRYTAALSSFFRGQRLVFLVMLFSAILICATPWPEEIHDGPIIIAALKVPNTEVSSFGSPQSATK